jgi:hypothetical protein
MVSPTCVRAAEETPPAIRVMERAMTSRNNKAPPALKHAGYSATTLLPGESAAEFKKLHESLIREFVPDGALEDDIVARLAHLVWRRQHLETFRRAELAQRRMAQIRSAMVPSIDRATAKSKESEEPVQFGFIETLHAAEERAREELGELYDLVEIGEEATIDQLVKELQVIERLDAAIDRCIKRLLMVRGLKSMLIGEASSVPLQAIPGPPSAA